MATAGELLRRYEPDVIEQRGPLSFTEKQTDIVRAAIDNQDMDVEDLADMVGAHTTYVRSVLRRVQQEDLEGFQPMSQPESPQPADEETPESEEQEEAEQGESGGESLDYERVAELMESEGVDLAIAKRIVQRRSEGVTEEPEPAVITPEREGDDNVIQFTVREDIPVEISVRVPRHLLEEVIAEGAELTPKPEVGEAEQAPEQ